MLERQKLTKGPELLEAINSFVLKATRFIDPQNKPIEFARWNRESDALMRVNVVEGCLVKARLGEIQGDASEVEYWIGNAQKNGVSRSELAEHLLVAYCNLGYASKGLDTLRSWVGVAHGNIGRTLRLTPAVGAFQYMNFLLNAAVKARIELNDAQPWPMASEASAVLTKNGVDDDVCAKVIDVAGEVLRKHRLFWTGPQQPVLVDDQADAVLMRFNVGVSYEQAAALNLEAIDLLIERDLDTCPFKIDFVGVRA